MEYIVIAILCYVALFASCRVFSGWQERKRTEAIKKAYQARTGRDFLGDFVDAWWEENKEPAKLRAFYLAHKDKDVLERLDTLSYEEDHWYGDIHKGVTLLTPDPKKRQEAIETLELWERVKAYLAEKYVPLYREELVGLSENINLQRDKEGKNHD